MSKYDGWAMKYEWSETVFPGSFHVHRTGVVEWWEEGGIPELRWKNASRREGMRHKIVKVKLVEVEDE